MGRSVHAFLPEFRRRFVRIRRCRAAYAREIIAKDYRRSHFIKHASVFAGARRTATLQTIERLLRFPATQPFVHELNGKPEMLPDALRKPFRFLRHFTLAAVKHQRPSDNDCADVMKPAKVAQSSQIVAAVGASPGVERPSRYTQFIRECKAEAPPAIIHTENGTANIGTKLAAKFGTKFGAKFGARFGR